MEAALIILTSLLGLYWLLVSSAGKSFYVFIAVIFVPVLYMSWMYRLPYLFALLILITLFIMTIQPSKHSEINFRNIIVLLPVLAIFLFSVSKDSTMQKTVIYEASFIHITISAFFAIFISTITMLYIFRRKE